MHGQVILIMEHDLFSINVFVKCVGLMLNQTKDKVVNPFIAHSGQKQPANSDEILQAKA